MPENANEHAPTTSQDSQAETTAGKSSPAALPTVGTDILARLKVTQCCDVAIDGMLGAAIEEIEHLRADLKEARERVAALEAAMNPQDVADVDAALRNKEKSDA